MRIELKLKEEAITFSEGIEMLVDVSKNLNPSFIKNSSIFLAQLGQLKSFKK